MSRAPAKLDLMDLDLVLRDARLADGAALDIGVRDGRIAALERDLPRSGEEVDCAGALVLPGLIDNHVHYREPGATWKEGYVTGTAASARGGATTVGEVQNNAPLLDTVERWRAKAASIERRSRVRVLAYANALRTNLAQIEPLARAAPALKLFLAGDERLEVNDAADLRAIFESVAAADGLLVLHAEDGPLVRAGLERFGDRAADFSKARSTEAELVAVQRCIELCAATRARIHFFHVSTADACARIRAAKARGLPVSAAACAHYLLFTDADVSERGAILKCNPSIKSAADRAALRAAVADGTLDVIQSDHAPHPRAEKEQAFRAAPSGIPGADLLLPLWLQLVDEGVLTLAALVERACEAPARLHRLDSAAAAPAATIRVGARADLVLIEERERAVAESDFASKAKLSPYVGMRLRRWPSRVWVGGRLVYDRARGEDLDALERAAAPPLESETRDTRPPACC